MGKDVLRKGGILGVEDHQEHLELVTQRRASGVSNGDREHKLPHKTRSRSCLWFKKVLLGLSKTAQAVKCLILGFMPGVMLHISNPSPGDGGIVGRESSGFTGQPSQNQRAQGSTRHHVWTEADSDPEEDNIYSSLLVSTHVHI